MLIGEPELRRVVPDFDLLKIDDVLSLNLLFSYVDRHGKKWQQVDMSLTFSYPGPSAPFMITLLLVGVRDLHLPKIGGSMFELGELAIAIKEDRAAEGLHYVVEDTLDGMVCRCADVRFLSIAPAADYVRRESS
jgi:hypothetical protein